MSTVPAEAAASPIQDASVARDESRLSMIAYWLERYRDSDFDTARDKKKKYQRLVANLETTDAKIVADAWFAGKPIPTPNRFGKVASLIQTWASTASGKRP